MDETDIVTYSAIALMVIIVVTIAILEAKYEIKAIELCKEVGYVDHLNDRLYDYCLDNQGMAHQVLIKDKKIYLVEE